MVTTSINALFVLVLAFFEKWFIFQIGFSGKLFHFLVFGNDHENELRMFSGVWKAIFL